MLTIYKTCNCQFCNIQPTVPLNDVSAILTSPRLETVPETCIHKHLLAYFVFQRPQIYPIPCMDISKFRWLSADLGVGNSWMYGSLTSQLEKPWNFLSSSDLHALRMCHYSTKSGFYH